MIEYYNLLEKESGGRLKVVNMGQTTMGNPFLEVFISSAGNMARLEQLRQVNARISDPRGLAEPEVRKLVAEGKAVVCQSMSLHATEIGGTQMAPELAYDLLSRQDEETGRILDNVIFIMVPSFNPDGEIMVADWYSKTLGTEYEGSNPPGCTTSTPATTTIATPFRPTWWNRSTWPRSCSRIGSRRPTSTTITRAATALAFSCRRTPSPFVLTPTPWCGAS
jgi:hypothetical protein